MEKSIPTKRWEEWVEKLTIFLDEHGTRSGILMGVGRRS
jgi:hypothetical protein